MVARVVIIQGSKSDDEYAEKIVSRLQHYGFYAERRIASAHKSPIHLQRILDQIEADEARGLYSVVVTVAGLSDALSGAVAARFSGRTIAAPPDALEYGEAKFFSSTKLPKGIEVIYAINPEEVAKKVREVFKTYDFSKVKEFRWESIAKRLQTVMDDARLQGVDYPLPLTLWKKGKVRDVYDCGDRLLINCTDRISAFDVNSVTEIEGKGMSLNLLSAWWFRQTESVFPNHFISLPDVTMMLVKKAERIDIEWVMRGYLYGSMYREYAKGGRELYGYKLPNGLQIAEKLPEVMLTPTTKAEEGHDIPITKQKAIKMGLLTVDEWKELEEASFKLYGFYTDVANQKGFIIPDFKLEFGRYKGELIQIDEPPNHDSARIWIKKYYQVGKRQEAWCVDKEFYRQFLIDSGIDPKSPPNPLPEIPQPVTREIQKRLGAYEVFIGNKSIDDLGLRSLEDVEIEVGLR